MQSASRRAPVADAPDPAHELILVDDAGRRPDPSASPQSGAEQIGRLTDLTALSDAQIGELLGVTRANVRQWLRGQEMRRACAEHLGEILSVVVDAHRRFGTAERTRLALLTPVGPGRPRPFDYLRDRSYLVAGGFLQVIPDALAADWTPIRPGPTLPRDVRLATLEELSPTPRFELDDDFLP